MKFKVVNPKENFPSVEDNVLKFWKKRHIFEKSINQRPKSNNFVFYDGPPFITGIPHYGTLLSRIAKDVVPRYWAMNGKRVERQWGWDAHGLPIENKVENKLGLKNKRDIEKIGILEFTKMCYSYTEETSADWEWYKDKIGQWVDFENAYYTTGQDSMETVMWVFKTLHDKGLVYEGVRVSLFCTRCGTPISNFEIAMDNSYEIMNDPAVTIQFALEGEENTYVLAWTTTPWTLPSNRALVINKDEKYVKVKRTINVKYTKTVRALILKGDQVALIKVGRDNTYSLPGGKLIDGLSVEDTLLQEMEEETGYKDVKVVKRLGSFRNQFKLRIDTIIDEHSEVFLVEIDPKNRVSPKFHKSEKEQSKLQFEWVNIAEAPGKLARNGISYKFLESYKEDKEIHIEGNLIAAKSYSEHLILAKKRLEETFTTESGEKTLYKIEKEFNGSELIGKSYEPLYNFFPANENDFKIYAFEDMVTMDDGVGVVHSAPGFGEIDTKMGNHYGLTTMFSVNDEGKFVDDVTPWKGVYIKDAEPSIILDLMKRQRVFRSNRVDHRYPYCYRCHTPLIHKAQNQWYIDIQSLKKKMLKNNENINWVPEHIKNGRFKKGIESAPDWGISRTRYWATPMPVWRDLDAKENPETIIISSRDELRDLVTEPITRIYLINPSLSKEEDDPHLTTEGWDQSRDLESKLHGKIDLIYTADLARTKDTISPFEENDKDISVIIDPILGNPKDEVIFLEKRNEILKNNDETIISYLSEEVIEGTFNEYEEALKVKIDNIIKEHIGKSIAICLPDYFIPLIRSSFQKVTRRVAYRTNPNKGKWKKIFFDGNVELDLHRPFIDKFTIKSKKTGKILHRISDVLDVWMDSGSMPYAMKHYPFDSKTKFENNFPADYIAEYIAQTRAWFYVMHVLSTALFDTNSFKNVVVTGVLSGNDGRKMSKSYGNYPDPKKTILEYGADPLRLYFMGSRLMVGGDLAINENGIKDQIKTIILPLWNSYSFFVTYANQHGFKPGPELVQSATDRDNWTDIPFEPVNKLNIWVISKLQETIHNIRMSFEEYNLTKVVQEYPTFLNALSKWYIRRSRDKFMEGDEEFLKTLYYVLVEFIKLLAPLAPFITEEIYRNLVKDMMNHTPESIHLMDFPDDDSKFVEKHASSMAKMDIVREIVSLGQTLRVTNSLKVRQPLSEMEVHYEMDPTRDIELEQWMKTLITDELNIKLIQEDRNLNDYTGWVQAKGDKYGLKISMNIMITDELKREGVLRELQRGIQSVRKKAGLNINDLVDIEITTDSTLVQQVLTSHMDILKQFVKASSIVVLKETPIQKKISIENEPVDIIIKK